MIEFRKFTEEDIEKVVYWIFQPHVLDVWDSAQGVSKDVIEEKYKNRLDDDSIETYIITVDDIDIGLIQTYLIDNQADFGLLQETAKGIDLYIGNPDYVNKGYGTRVMNRFIKDHVFSDPNVLYACIDPELSNERAIRVYEKTGFTVQNVAYSSYSNLLTCYMILSRKKYEKKA